MITGLHTLIYSDDAEATRAFLRDVMGWPFVDAHEGWLIFRSPPAEVGVHPTMSDDGKTRWGTTPLHQLSFMCEDIEATIAELRAKGVEVSGEVEDQGFGLVSNLTVPGAGEMMLYQPRHEVAHSLPD